MPDRAGEVEVPVLVLHGGRDVFAATADVRRFPDAFPAGTPVEFHYYPESHHLLFYDRDRQQVLRDTEGWLLGLGFK